MTRKAKRTILLGLLATVVMLVFALLLSNRTVPETRDGRVVGAWARDNGSLRRLRFMANGKGFLGRVDDKGFYTDELSFQWGTSDANLYLKYRIESWRIVRTSYRVNPETGGIDFWGSSSADWWIFPKHAKKTWLQVRQAPVPPAQESYSRIW